MPPFRATLSKTPIRIAHWVAALVLLTPASGRVEEAASEALSILERGAPFSEDETETLRLWAKQGSDWKSRGELLLLIGDGIELVELIRAKILETPDAGSEAEMAGYEAKIPQTEVPYDMLGNVMEWCLDQYDPGAYATGRATLPADWLHPRVIRGGSWYDDPERLRAAARTASDPDWNSDDVDVPKSIWYLTDAIWLGFRIVRPLEVPSTEEMHWYWNSASGLDSSNPSR